MEYTWKDVNFKMLWKNKEEEAYLSNNSNTQKNMLSFPKPCIKTIQLI